MLVLSRKVGEKLFITTPEGHRIEVTVSKIENGAVALGIDAPRDYGIFREELWNRICLQQQATAKPDTSPRSLKTP